MAAGLILALPPVLCFPVPVTTTRGFSARTSQNTMVRREIEKERMRCKRKRPTWVGGPAFQHIFQDLNGLHNLETVKVHAEGITS